MDTDILRLYDFIYSNLAEVKKALFHVQPLPNEAPEAGMGRLQALTTMTSQVGNSARKEPANGQQEHPVQISASVNIGDYNEFMERFKGRNIDEFNSAGIFYLAGMSRVFFHFARLRK